VTAVVPDVEKETPRDGFRETVCKNLQPRFMSKAFRRRDRLYCLSRQGRLHYLHVSVSSWNDNWGQDHGMDRTGFWRSLLELRNQLLRQRHAV